jgi:hypothetical protein
MIRLLLLFNIYDSIVDAIKWFFKCCNVCLLLIVDLLIC